MISRKSTQARPLASLGNTTCLSWRRQTTSDPTMPAAFPYSTIAATRAFTSFLKPTQAGGVCFTDEQGDFWFEEYVVSPPTHILNGFIWAAWGVYDFFLATKDETAQRLFNRAVETMHKNLDRYDL